MREKGSISSRPLWLVSKNHELVLREGLLRVCTALIVGELDFEDGRRQHFNHSADLAAAQTFFGQICSERDDIE